MSMLIRMDKVTRRSRQPLIPVSWRFGSRKCSSASDGVDVLARDDVARCIQAFDALDENGDCHLTKEDLLVGIPSLALRYYTESLSLECLGPLRPEACDHFLAVCVQMVQERRFTAGTGLRVAHNDNFCPCGNLMMRDAIFCRKCGRKRDGATPNIAGDDNQGRSPDSPTEFHDTLDTEVNPARITGI